MSTSRGFGDQHPATSLASGPDENDSALFGKEIEIPPITAIDKRFWMGVTTVKVSDMERAQSDLIETLTERVDKLDGTESGVSDEENHSVPRRHSGSSVLSQPTFHDVLNGGIADEALEEDGRTIFGLNMISNALSVSSNLELFGEESLFAFDDWAERFRDYLFVSGKNWTEEEKVRRLKLALKDTPRALFKELAATQTGTVEDALDALRDKLDSPQRRELAKRTLALCKQREEESVAQFLRRLTPLVEVINPSLDAAQRKEKVCEEFLDRLKPNLSFLIRLVGLTQAKNLDMVKAQAEELEALLLMNKGEETGRFSQVLNALKDQTTQQSDISRRPATGGNAVGIGNNRTWSFRPYTTADVQRSQNSSRSRSNFQNWGRGRQERFSQRNWSNRPRCDYCRRTGHFAYSCWARKNQFQESSARGDRQVRWADQQRQPSPMRRQSPGYAVNAVEAPAPSNGFMEDLVKSLINMNVQNLPSRAGMERDDQKSKAMNSIMQIESKQEPEVGKSGSKVNRIESTLASGQNEKTEKQLKTSNWENMGARARTLPISLSSIMMIFMLFALAKLGQSERPAHPLMCQTQQEGKVWQLPEVEGCARLALDHSKAPVTRTLRIFSPNIFERSVEAWACRRVKKTIRKYTTITGVPVQEALESESQVVSLDECRQMIDHGKCSLGVLTNESGLLHTDRKIDISPRMWLLGSFNWKPVESENCYLFKTKVTLKHGESHIQTPLGPAVNCYFKQGRCVMEDRTTLIWDVDSDRNCEYTEIGIWSGLQLDNVWISDEVSFRLSFQNRTRKVYACAIGLEKTIEGFAVREVQGKKNRRSRRSINGFNGMTEGLSLVTESEVDAKLGYLDEKMTRVMQVSFSQALKSVCDYMVETRRWAASALLADPTGFARVLFKNARLVAKGMGPELIKVWPCIELEKNEYSFVPVGESEEGKMQCFDAIPIKFKLRGADQLAFVDPKTMIVSLTARKAPCEEFRKQLIFLSNTLMEVDQITAQIKQVEVDRIEKIGLGLPDLPSFAPHSFHHMTIVNVSDILGQVYDAGMARVSEITFGIHKSDTVVTTTMSDQWSEVKDELEEAAFGRWIRIGWWILVVAVVVLVAELLLRTGLVIKYAYTGKSLTEGMAVHYIRPKSLAASPSLEGVTIIGSKRMDGKELAELPECQDPVSGLQPIKLIQAGATKERKRTGKRTRATQRLSQTSTTVVLCVAVALTAICASTDAAVPSQVRITDSCYNEGILLILAFIILPVILILAITRAISSYQHKSVSWEARIRKDIEHLAISGLIVEADSPWVTPIMIGQKRKVGSNPALTFDARMH